MEIYESLGRTYTNRITNLNSLNPQNPIKLFFSLFHRGENMNSDITQPQLKPITKPKTKTELVRIVRIEPTVYRMVRSFVESSLKSEYPWRTGYEDENGIVWLKKGKWELRVYKNAEYVSGYEKLPVIGIYRITERQISPIAVLQSIERPGMFLEFVMLKDVGVAILHIAHPYNLAFAENAPIAFLPSRSVPFARPILIREIIDTLSQYVEIS